MSNADLSPETRARLREIWEEARSKPRRPEPCRATYPHGKHPNCSGIEQSEESAVEEEETVEYILTVDFAGTDSEYYSLIEAIEQAGGQVR